MLDSPDGTATTTSRRGDWHIIVQWIALSVAIVIALLPATPNRLGLIATRTAGFRLVMLLVLALNVWWWAAADNALCRILTARRVRIGRTVLLLACGIAVIPVAAMLLRGRIISFAAFPPGYIGAVQMWYMSLAILAPVAVCNWLARMWLTVLRRRRAPNIAPMPLPATSDRPTRRDLLRATALFAPTLAVGAAAVAGGRQSGRFIVRRHTQAAPWLPDRLRGMTITHLSDLHVGRLFRPEFLPRLVDVVNHLRSDLVVVTGDIVDASNDMLPPTIEALHQMVAPRGMFLCMGNHDQIDNRDELIAALRGSELDLLINQVRLLHIDGEELRMAGLDWSGRDLGPRNHAEHVRATISGPNAGGDKACIALAHHPHAFDALSAAGVQFTLSGHTHGGQFMLRPPDPQGRNGITSDWGLGSTVFRYVRGFYRRGNQTLFVNSGIGNWFPLRINAPAEIVQIQFV